MDFIDQYPERPVKPFTFLLAHGAGAPMDSEFMNVIAEGVCSEGFHVRRFEFPYMVERRVNGKKRPPNRAPVLLESFAEAVALSGGGTQIVVAGKSMGGRMASMLATELDVLGVVCLGYPFHPPGKLETTRLDHFSSIKSRTLILQGTRDPFGGKQHVAGYTLPETMCVRWLEDGDHDFKPRKKSGLTHADNLKCAIEEISAFLKIC